MANSNDEQEPFTNYGSHAKKKPEIAHCSENPFAVTNEFERNTFLIPMGLCGIVNDVIRIIKHNVFISQLSWQLDLSGFRE